jgi:ubiquinone/menaquinone biosynthesis C-methylase UbiE
MRQRQDQSNSSTNMTEELYVVSDLEVDVDSTAMLNSEFDNNSRSTISTPTTSTVADYRVEHGRRYHAFKENQYWLPNDDLEIERLDIQHHCWRLSLAGKLYLSPLPTDVHHVIDIGTGGGQWAIEFAESHPSAKVIGTDLSPIQPKRTPPNCTWLVSNAEQDWVYHDKFHFVHSRMLMMGIHNWPEYFKRAWENLKPGGWVEVQEVIFPMHCIEDVTTTKSPLWLWSNYIKEAAAKDGIDTLITQKFKAFLEAQGFVNVREQKVVWPCGPWAKGQREKTLGHWAYENTKIFLDGAVALLIKRLGWTQEEVDRFLVEVRADMDNKNKHYYWALYVLSFFHYFVQINLISCSYIYSAQKPEET